MHIFFLRTTPNSSPKGEGGGGGILHMHICFPIGPRPSPIKNKNIFSYISEILDEMPNKMPNYWYFKFANGYH